MTTVTYHLFDGEKQIPLDAYGPLTSVLGDQPAASRNIAYAVGFSTAHLNNNPELACMHLSITGAVTGAEYRMVCEYVGQALMHLYNRTRNTEVFSFNNETCTLTIHRV
jgi:hypothetical protein